VGVKVTEVPEQIVVADAAIEIVGVTDVATFPFPVGLFVVGVKLFPPPFPPMFNPLEATEASITALLQEMLDFKSTTRNNDIVVAELPEAVGVVENELNVAELPGLLIVCIKVALENEVLVP
jgi:hypothetical protein